MSLLSTLRMKKQFRKAATLTLATPATDKGVQGPTVAKVATVTVASLKLPKLSAANDPSESERELIEERAAIMEYDGGMDRAKAERLANLHTDYLLHHWTCPTCCSAELLQTKRCSTGLELWNAYESEASR